MICPKCHEPLEVVEYNGIEIDRCQGCQGIWFDHREEEELKKLRGAAEALDIGDEFVGASHDDLQHTNCPRCEIPLHQVSHEGTVNIRFERCNQCKGSYFDAGEFTDYMADEIFDEFESIMVELGSLESGQNLVDS